ncbi:MAG: DUF4169 family protein [Marinibacterium sp.]
MSKPVNLGRIRKDRARAEAKRQADANSAKFGRTKAEKIRDQAAAAAAKRHLDGHKSET